MSLIPVNDNGALKITILMGSPRHKGNTAELLKPFMIALHELNQFQESLHSTSPSATRISHHVRDAMPVSRCRVSTDVSRRMTCGS